MPHGCALCNPRDIHEWGKCLHLHVWSSGILCNWKCYTSSMIITEIDAFHFQLNFFNLHLSWKATQNRAFSWNRTIRTLQTEHHKLALLRLKELVKRSLPNFLVILVYFGAGRKGGNYCLFLGRNKRYVERRRASVLPPLNLWRAISVLSITSVVDKLNTWWSLKATNQYIFLLRTRVPVLRIDYLT